VRKLLLAAMAAALAVVGFSALALGNAGEAGTSWELTLKPNKVDKPAKNTNAVVEPSKVDDQGTADTSDDVWTPASKNTLTFAKGTSIDTSALGRCKLSASEVAQGSNCPKNTKVGDGSATAVTGGTPVGSNGQRRGGTEVQNELDAFNTKKTLMLVLTVCGGGTGPGTGTECAPVTRVVLEGKWSKTTTKPKLAVPTPPGLLDVGIVVKRFELNLGKHTKTVKQNGKEVLKSFIFTPDNCGGKWKSQDKAQYVDGTSQTIKDTQKCKKP
jgi:hypothetical protein